MKNMIHEVIKLKRLKYRANKPNSITQKLTFCKITCTSSFGVLVQGVQQNFFYYNYFITKCDKKFITKCVRLFTNSYYKMRRLLQIFLIRLNLTSTLKLQKLYILTGETLT